MAKVIKFTYDDINYTLEFTRRTIRNMESNGFLIDEVEKKPATYIPALFSGAFKAHHAVVKDKVISEIYASMTDKGNLISTLVDMYNETLLTLIDEPTGDESKNVSWTAE